MKTLKICLLIFCFILSGCAQKQTPSLKVGVIEGLGDEIIAKVQKNAAAQGFVFEIVTFKDYTEINTALKQKKIDINCFQNQYWLDSVNKNRQTNFASIGKTYLSPMGGYSSSYQTLSDLPQKAKIALPDDTYSIARTLLLLEQANLIKLKKTNFLPVLADIERNEKQLVLTPVNATQIRNSFSGFDLVFLGLNYARSINLQPKTALILEDISSDFTQLIVTRNEDKNKPEILQFVQFYQSAQNKDFINKTYNGNLLPAW